MAKAINAAGQLIDVAGVSDIDRASAQSRADTHRSARDAQSQAKAEQESLERDAVQYFIRGEAFPAELKDYHAALSDVIAAPVGEMVPLPERPVLANQK